MRESYTGYRVAHYSARLILDELELNIMAPACANRAPAQMRALMKVVYEKLRGSG